MANSLSVTGRIVADPEYKVTANGRTLLSFPLYDNERRKNKDTGEYEDTGRYLKVDVTLWGDQAEEASKVLNKGDVIRVVTGVMQDRFEDKQGNKRETLETTFVDSYEIVWSKPVEESSYMDEEPAF